MTTAMIAVLVSLISVLAIAYAVVLALTMSWRSFGDRAGIRYQRRVRSHEDSGGVR